MTGAAVVLAAGAVAVLPVVAASAGAAINETAISAAEMVLIMVVSSWSEGIAGLTGRMAGPR
jgi:hypothetical protein